MTEKKIAKDIGAKLIKNSGRGWQKGDMRLDVGPFSFIVDAKEGESFSLSEKKWQKICSDAFSWGIQFIPMVLREFPSGVKVAMVPFDVIEELIEGGHCGNGRCCQDEDSETTGKCC